MNLSWANSLTREVLSQPFNNILFNIAADKLFAGNVVVVRIVLLEELACG